MSRDKALELEKLLGEVSWLLSHVEALQDEGRNEEATAELERAAAAEEQAASLLDAAGRESEAAIHRVSTASSRELLGEYGRAVSLLRAALAMPLTDKFRRDVEEQLSRCLRSVQQERLPTYLQETREPAVTLN